MDRGAERGVHVHVDAAKLLVHGPAVRAGDHLLDEIIIAPRDRGEKHAVEADRVRTAV